MVWCEAPGSRTPSGDDSAIRRAAAEGKKARKDGAESSGNRQLGTRTWPRKRRQDLRMGNLGARKRRLEASQRKGKGKERRQERQEGNRGSKERVEGQSREAGQVAEEFEDSPFCRLASAVPGGRGADDLKRLIGERGLAVWWLVIEKVNDLATLGCALAWLAVTSPLLGSSSNSQRFLRSVLEKVAGSHGPSSSARGAIFPVALGNLGPVHAVLINYSLNEVV